MLTLKIKSSFKFILIVFIFLYNLSLAQDKIAIFYSTILENQFGLDSKKSLEEITSWELFLMQNKILYEVIYDDDLETGIENEFEILILPSIQKINLTQYESLKNFLNAGNSILSIGSKLYPVDNFSSNFINLENLFDIKSISSNQTEDLNCIHTISSNHLNHFKNFDQNTIQISNLNELMVFDQVENEELVCGSLITDDEVSLNKSSISYGKVGNGKYLFTGFGLNDVIGGKIDVEKFQQLILQTINWMDSKAEVYFQLQSPDSKKPSILFLEFNNAVEPELIDVLNFNEFNPNLLVSNQTIISEQILSKFNSENVTLDISSILESRTNPESVKELVLSFKKENNLELTSVFVNDELTKQEYLNIYKEIGIKNIIVNSNVGGNPIIEDSDLIKLAIRKNIFDNSGVVNVVYYSVKNNCTDNKEDDLLNRLNQFDKAKNNFTSLCEIKKWCLTKENIKIKTISNTNNSIEFIVLNNNLSEVNDLEIFLNAGKKITLDRISISSGEVKHEFYSEPNTDAIHFKIAQMQPHSTKKFIINIAED